MNHGEINLLIYILKQKKEYYKEGIELYREGDIKPEDVEVTFHLQGTIQGLNYPVHPDTPSKLMTFLVYLNPEKQEPTYFHEYDRNLMQKTKEKDKNPIKSIDWEVNNGYFFSSK